MSRFHHELKVNTFKLHTAGQWCHVTQTQLLCISYYQRSKGIYATKVTTLKLKHCIYIYRKSLRKNNRLFCVQGYSYHDILEFRWDLNCFTKWLCVFTKQLVSGIFLGNSKVAMLWIILWFYVLVKSHLQILLVNN